MWHVCPIFANAPCKVPMENPWMKTEGTYTVIFNVDTSEYLRDAVAATQQ